MILKGGLFYYNTILRFRRILPWSRASSPTLIRSLVTGLLNWRRGPIRSPITDLHQPMRVIPRTGTTTDHYSNRRRSIPSRSTTSSPFGYYRFRGGTPTSIPLRIPCLQLQRQYTNLQLVKLTSQGSILCFHVMHIEMKPNKYQQ